MTGKTVRDVDRYQAVLASLLVEEENKYCADCQAKGTGGLPGGGGAWWDRAGAGGSPSVPTCGRALTSSPSACCRGLLESAGVPPLQGPQRYGTAPPGGQARMGPGG